MPAPTPVISVYSITAARMVPCAVFVNCSSTTPGAGRLDQCYFQWDFDDTDIAPGDHVTFPDPRDTSKTRDIVTDQRGFAAANLYRTAGTYTIRLTVTNIDGDSASTTTTVEVVADTRAQRYVDLTGNDGNDGSSGSPWLTRNHALTQANASGAMTLNYRTGTYDMTAAHQRRATGNNIIEQADTGASPIFRYTSPVTNTGGVVEIGSTVENYMLRGVTVTASNASGMRSLQAIRNFSNAGATHHHTVIWGCTINGFPNPNSTNTFKEIYDNSIGGRVRGVLFLRNVCNAVPYGKGYGNDGVDHHIILGDRFYSCALEALMRSVTTVNEFITVAFSDWTNSVGAEPNGVRYTFETNYQSLYDSFFHSNMGPMNWGQHRNTPSHDHQYEGNIIIIAGSLSQATPALHLSNDIDGLTIRNNVIDIGRSNGWALQMHANKPSVANRIDGQNINIEHNTIILRQAGLRPFLIHAESQLPEQRDSFAYQNFRFRNNLVIVPAAYSGSWMLFRDQNIVEANGNVWCKVSGDAPNWRRARAYAADSIDLGTEIITLRTNHSLTNGESVRLRSAGALPSASPALNETTNYFVRSQAVNQVSLHPTANDANNDTNRINITADNDDFVIMANTAANYLYDDYDFAAWNALDFVGTDLQDTLAPGDLDAQYWFDTLTFTSAGASATPTDGSLDLWGHAKPASNGPVGAISADPEGAPPESPPELHAPVVQLFLRR
jgi:hypothetical protein